MPLFSDKFFKPDESEPDDLEVEANPESDDEPFLSDSLLLSVVENMADKYLVEHMYPEEEFLHKCKDGRLIPISQLSDSHLANIIKLLTSKAEIGITVRQGGGADPDEFWYEEYTLKGLAAAAELNLPHYWREAGARFARQHATSNTATYTPLDLKTLKNPG